MLLCVCVSSGLYVHLLPTQLNTAIFRPFFKTVVLHTPAGLNILLLCTCRCVRNHFVEKLEHQLQQATRHSQQKVLDSMFNNKHLSLSFFLSLSLFGGEGKTSLLAPFHHKRLVS